MHHLASICYVREASQCRHQTHEISLSSINITFALLQMINVIFRLVYCLLLDCRLSFVRWRQVSGHTDRTGRHHGFERPEGSMKLQSARSSRPYGLRTPTEQLTAPLEWPFAYIWCSCLSSQAGLSDDLKLWGDISSGKTILFWRVLVTHLHDGNCAWGKCITCTSLMSPAEEVEEILVEAGEGSSQAAYDDRYWIVASYVTLLYNFLYFLLACLKFESWLFWILLSKKREEIGWMDSIVSRHHHKYLAFLLVPAF